MSRTLRTCIQCEYISIITIKIGVTLTTKLINRNKYKRRDIYFTEC